MSDEIKRMDIAEFREFGFLQEINRRFLHPMGVALEVIVDDDGSERLGGVWDYRDDAEGIAYGPGMIDVEKARRFDREWSARREARVAALGYMIQSEIQQ